MDAILTKPFKIHVERLFSFQFCSFFVAGIPIRTVKSFLTKIPSVFTGQDLIQWLVNNLDLSEPSEALMLANRMAECGYLFPIGDNDHVLQVKNDGTYYRFQVSY